MGSSLAVHVPCVSCGAWYPDLCGIIEAYSTVLSNAFALGSRWKCTGVDLPSIGKVRGQTTEPSLFWRVAGAVPAPNADTIALHDAFAFLPHSFTHVTRQWTPQEESELELAILHNLQVGMHSINESPAAYTSSRSLLSRCQIAINQIPVQVPTWLVGNGF